MAEQRYTLSLPPEIYNELRAIAEKHDMSIKEAVRRCLGAGLLAIKAASEDDPALGLFIRERLPSTGEGDAKVVETRVRFI